MKGLFIVNPSSGMRILQNTVYSLEKMLLSKGVATEIAIFYTQKGGDAYEKAKSLKKGEVDFVLAVGGDGTVSEVTNGIIDGKSEIPMTILGAGTTNDFATVLGIAPNANSLFKIIKDFHVEKTDVGVLNGKYFINVASGGMISEIAHNITTEQKSALGKFAYYAEGAKELGNIKKLSTTTLKYEWDEGEFEEDTFLLVVCNSRQSGGFSKIAPTAKLNDGLLDVCIIRKVGITDVVPLFNKIQAGTHANDPRTNYFTTSKLRVTKVNKNDRFALDSDGENAGELPMEISVARAAINIIVPKNNNKTKLLYSKD